MTETSYAVTSPVLVTGATGYLAGWIIKRLVKQGVEVHAAVRDPENAKKLAHLKKLDAENPGSVKFFKADLLEEGSFDEAMQGCKVVFHTASPVLLTSSNPQKDLVDPALKGTRNVLQSANNVSSVSRVVLTSSALAMYGDNKDLQNLPNAMLTESNWNETSSIDHQPYAYSKVLAEKEAWSICSKQNRWELVVVNPTLVFGPGLSDTHTAQSFGIIKQFGDGLLKSGCPDLWLGIVDVRDAADAHLSAAFTPQASGRYLVNGSNTNFLEIAENLRPEYAKYPLPTRTIPKFILWVIGPCVNKALTRKIVSTNIGYPFQADASKSIKELGITYRPLKETVCDFFQQLIDFGNIEAR